MVSAKENNVSISGDTIPPYLEWEPEQSSLFILLRDGGPGSRENQLFDPGLPEGNTQQPTGP